MKMDVCSIGASFVSVVSLWFTLFDHKGTKSTKIPQAKTTHLSPLTVYPPQTARVQNRHEGLRQYKTA